MRIIVALVLWLVSNTAKAETYYVDATIGGNILFSNVCNEATSCGPNGYKTQLYNFQTGDTIDFGTLVLSSFVFYSTPTF